MLDQIIKSLFSWAILGLLAIITLSYVISYTVLPRINAYSADYSVDKYEAYLIGK